MNANFYSTSFSMKQKYSLTEISALLSFIKKPSLVFLYGQVWAGKTTLVSHYIAQRIWKRCEDINSPTYVYYNTYDDTIHFDLYRLKEYDTFVSIGGEEILDNNSGVIFVEWPEILEPYYIPDYKIYLSYDDADQDCREIEVVSCA